MAEAEKQIRVLLIDDDLHMLRTLGGQDRQRTQPLAQWAEEALCNHPAGLFAGPISSGRRWLANW